MAQNKEEKIWTLMDKLELYGKERTDAEPMIRAFQKQTEQDELERIERALTKIMGTQIVIPKAK